MDTDLQQMAFSDALMEKIYAIASENNFDEETFYALDDLINLLVLGKRTKEQVRDALKEYLGLPEITVVKIMSRIERDILSFANTPTPQMPLKVIVKTEKEIKSGLLGRLMNKAQ